MKTDLLYSNGGKDDTLKKPRWQPAIGTNNSNCDNEIKSSIMPGTSSAIEDERDPDVIPSHYATEHYMHTNQLTPEKYIITTTNHSDNKFSIKNSPFSTHLLETLNQLSNHITHHNSQSQLFQHAGGGGVNVGGGGGSTNLGPSNITIGPLVVGGSDLDINISAIKDRLMTTPERGVPESCV